MKTTSGTRIGLRPRKVRFQHLVAFKIYSDGTFEILYNGDGTSVYEVMRQNRSSRIEADLLKTLDVLVPRSERLQRRDP